MSHFNGVHFGSDQVSGFDDPPLEFNLYEDGPPHLRAKNEPPRESFAVTPTIEFSWNQIIVLLLIVIIALQLHMIVGMNKNNKWLI